jgi:[acyl-carrier-protein] S-malonyltransferase
MKKMAVLFPGQGPQYPGMGKMIYESSAAARLIYEEASELLHYDLARHSFEGSLDILSDTRYTQPALVVVGYTAYRYYIDNMGVGGLPSFLAGHSMGEITALLCGQSLSFSDAVHLSVKRGELMSRVSQARGGAMAAVKELYWRDVEEICRNISTEEETVSIAAYNSNWQTVLTGHTGAVEAAGRDCMEKGGIFIPLNITVASHCPFMQDILAEYRDFVIAMKIQEPVIPVYCCLTGQLYTSAAEIGKNISDQLVYPVLWNRILHDLKRRGAGIFLEAGPGTPLGKFIDACDGTVIALEKSSIDKIRRDIGQQVRVIATPLTKCLALMISIPNGNESNVEYADMFIKNYREIQSLQDRLEKEERLPEFQEILIAVQALEPACLGKRVSADLMLTIKKEFIRQFPYTHELFSTAAGEVKSAI